MVQAIGYMRFSYPGRSDARLTHEDDPEALRAQLYDPLRMAQRFHFFEKICLPSLDAQTDQDFKLLILIGNDLPQTFKSRLLRAISNRPYAEVLEDSTGSLSTALNTRAADLKDPAADKILHFRLDDDDALASHAIHDLRQMAERVAAPTLLSLPRGLKYVEMDGEVQLVESVAPYIAIGWAMVLNPEVERNAFQASHLRIAQSMPSMVDPRKISYIHTIHAESDSRTGEAAKVRQLVARGRELEGTDHHARILRTLGREFPGFSETYLREVRLTFPRDIHAMSAPQVLTPMSA